MYRQRNTVENREVYAESICTEAEIEQLFEVFFEIGHLLTIGHSMSDLKSRRRPISAKRGGKVKKRGKGAGYNPWELWSDPCGARLAPGLKPLRLPRARY